MKFIGSKQRLSKDIVPIIQNIIDEANPKSYIEPFVGGANIIDKIKHSKKLGYDNNEYLIAMWKSLQSGWVIPDRPTREEYWEVKENKEKFPPEWVAIVGFVSTYNAKWFDGYANITKTKTGEIRDYYDEGRRNIEKQVPHIMGVDFIHADYRNLKPKKSVMYCDPPYVTQNTRKDLYGEEFNHEEYYGWVRKVSEDNIVICSEYSMPDDFVCIYEKGLNLHFDNRQRDKRTERLFVHQSLLNICPRCREVLLPSDLGNYNSVCLNCDENFGYGWLK